MPKLFSAIIATANPLSDRSSHLSPADLQAIVDCAAGTPVVPPDFDSCDRIGTVISAELAEGGKIRVVAEMLGDPEYSGPWFMVPCVMMTENDRVHHLVSVSLTKTPADLTLTPIERIAQ